LTEAFEALCSISSQTSAEKEEDNAEEDEAGTDYSHPHLDLHPDLQRDLSPSTVQRVSLYSIIHDINKETTNLQSHDPLALSGGSEADPQYASPLVMAALKGSDASYATMTPSHSSASYTSEPPQDACIDEEQWILRAITEEQEHTNDIASSCPPTFSQAMGEKEYENSRTQLWKPSRSWWEAKSGKNPWIEPASHNKRWRYLWPLIHYHKFLAKCIKKLKRNGVDVKTGAASPVTVFLREEVCHISDHLASVSLYSSEQWMESLANFSGWIVLSAMKPYRQFVRGLSLRGMSEPGDVESPLLRSQIDERFLRAINAAREEMRASHSPSTSNPAASSSTSTTPCKHHHLKMTKQPDHATASTAPVASASVTVTPNQNPAVPRQIIQGIRRPRGVDSGSVHSEISMNSYPQLYHHHHLSASYDPNAHFHHPMYYYAAAAATSTYSDHHSQTSGGTGYEMMDPRYYMDPTMAYYHPHVAAAAYHYPYHHAAVSPAMMVPAASETQGTSETPEEDPCLHNPSDRSQNMSASNSTPFKYDPENVNTMSPYWSHLDQATLAMGLATPARVTPSTPHRRPKDFTVSSSASSSSDFQHRHHPKEFLDHATAPLFRAHHYYMEGYAPPSPATQFMMTPQHHHHHASSFANYGYATGFSPRRLQKTDEERVGVSSPETVETTTESESDVPTNSVVTAM
jgi:hypothetical protein